MASFYYAGGGQLFGTDGNDPKAGCNFDDANGVAVTKYLVNLASDKKFSNEKEGSSISKFKKGKLVPIVPDHGMQKQSKMHLARTLVLQRFLRSM